MISLDAHYINFGNVLNSYKVKPIQSIDKSFDEKHESTPNPQVVKKHEDNAEISGVARALFEAEMSFNNNDDLKQAIAKMAASNSAYGKSKLRLIA